MVFAPTLRRHIAVLVPAGGKKLAAPAKQKHIPPGHFMPQHGMF